MARDRRGANRVAAYCGPRAAPLLGQMSRPGPGAAIRDTGFGGEGGEGFRWKCKGSRKNHQVMAWVFHKHMGTTFLFDTPLHGLGYGFQCLLCRSAGDMQDMLTSPRCPAVVVMFPP